MADEKKYSAKEAALAVLKKAEEMLTKSSFMKKSEWKPVNEQSPHISSHAFDDRANSGRHHTVSTNDGSNWEYHVADHKTGKVSGWKQGGSLEEAKKKALSHKFDKSETMDKSEDLMKATVFPTSLPAKGKDMVAGSGVKDRLGASSVGASVRAGNMQEAKNKLAGAKELGVHQSPKPNLPKTEEMGLAEQAPAAEAPPAEAAPEATPFIPTKAISSAKLSKFMERKHAKRKAAMSAPADPGMEKAGVHEPAGAEYANTNSAADQKKVAGMSPAGFAARSAKGNAGTSAGKADLAEAKAGHQKVLAEQKAMPKPKLPA